MLRACATLLCALAVIPITLGLVATFIEAVYGERDPGTIVNVLALSIPCLAAVAGGWLYARGSKGWPVWWHAAVVVLSGALLWILRPRPAVFMLLE